MLYPWWYVPYLTAPMLIAVIAVLHVIVSHYAVGGGILIALENQHAIRTGDESYRDYWYRHTKFFVLLTVAYGAITGVGIWWTIGLTSPLATQSLIRIFVFGWAMEWVFFMVEIVSAFCLYYGWHSLGRKTHIIIGWIYAIAAWISLVLITGITAFMLNSNGLLGNWTETGSFWSAFLNVQWIPQTLIRTGGSLLLASVYVFAHAAFILQDDELKTRVVKRMSLPMLVGAMTFGFGALGWLVNLPPNALRIIEQAPPLIIFFAVFAGAAGFLALLILLVLRDPRSVSFPLGFAMLFVAFACVAVGEFIREAVRKPFIVDGVVLGNQMFPQQIAQTQRRGFLTRNEWTRKGVARLDANDSRERDEKSRDSRGEKCGQIIFMYHCNNCHAAEVGFTAVAPMLTGLHHEEILHKIKRLNTPFLSMPTWCGTDEEAQWLADYLLTIRPSSLQDR